MPATEHTTLNRSWVLKIGAICLAFAVLGVWGLADALHVYPKRGRADAQYKQYLYLGAAKSAGRLAEASVPDPAARYAALAARSRELEQAAAQAGDRLIPQVVELAELRWLEAESRVGGLKPANTAIADPAARLQELTAKWSTTNPPKPLDAYDLPLQWFFALLGFTVMMWTFVTILRATRVRYGWDAAEQRLHLPSGESIVPGDVAEFDKRLWHKFYIVLHLKEGRAAVKLDLLRNTNLEGWVLAMERTAHPERAQEEGGRGEGGEGGEGTPPASGAPAPPSAAV